MKQILVLATLACLQVQASPLEGPMVAFLCNKPAMYFRDGVWLPDENVDCLQTGKDILDFCKRMYPDKDIRNVMETRDQVTIANWCQVGKSKCHHSEHTVTPYKCMEGAFESEALLVPEHCIFDHIYGDKACKESPLWGEEAKQSCQRDHNPAVRLASYAILTPCEEEIGKFRGVEYVCCPEDEADQIVDETDDSDSWSSEEDDEDDEDYIDDDDDEISDEDDDDDDVDDLGIDADLDLDLTVTGLNDEIDPDAEESVGNIHDQYMHNVEAQGVSEHEFFLKAKSDLQKHYHEKVTKMMKEWATARQRVQDMKTSDPKAAANLNKDITSRFQRTYEALEQEGMAEKKQLVTLHQQRVQAFLNDNKRQAFEKYLDLINEAQPDPGHILKVLKHYIRSEEKDRMHTLNHFKHVRDMDPAEADRQRDQTLEHLKIIEDRVQQSRQMLSRVPEYQKKIELQLDEFLKTFHEIDAGVDNIIRLRPLEDAVEKTVDEEILQQYKESEQQETKKEKTNEVIDNAFPDDDEEPKIIHVPLAKDLPGLAVSQFDNFDDEDDDLSEQIEDEHDLPELQHVAHIQENKAEVQQANYIESKQVNYKSEAMPASGALGIAVGGITVFVIIVIGIVVLRRRASTGRQSTGFVEVDQAASPEEKHVANMQINGYENPTYRYFEMGQPNDNA